MDARRLADDGLRSVRARGERRNGAARVALLLAWKRRAVVEGKPLTFAHLPSTLGSLAQLYDVEELLVVEPV